MVPSIHANVTLLFIYFIIITIISNINIIIGPLLFFCLLTKYRYMYKPKYEQKCGMFCQSSAAGLLA